MSSGPPARKHTWRTLLGAFNAAGPAVSGYWLNDPQGACALCASPYDGAARAFLRALRSEGI
jgi:hypothetical protein